MIANIRFTSLKSISLPLSSLHTPQPNKCNIHYLFDLSIKIPPPNSNASWTFSKMSWCFKENSLTNLKVRQGAFIEDKKLRYEKCLHKLHRCAIHSFTMILREPSAFNAPSPAFTHRWRLVKAKIKPKVHLNTLKMKKLYTRDTCDGTFATPLKIR